MVNYEKIFEPYYEGGWEAYPLETTLITAGALNAYDAAIMHIEDYLDTQADPNDNLAETYDDTETYAVGDYCIYNGVLYKCLEDVDEAEEFDPTKWQSCLVTDEMGHGGGGSNVTITPTLSTGTKIADFEIDGQSGELYAPTGGGGNTNMWTGTQAQYEAQASQIADGTLVNITDDEEHVQAYEIYSTNEQVIGTWFGETLYRKTFTGLSVATHADTWVKLGLNISNLNKVIKVDAYRVSENNPTKMAIAESQVQDGDVAVTVVSNVYDGTILIATIEYTKTTS